MSLKLNIYMAWQKKKKNRQILRLCRHHLMGAVLICQIFHFIIGPAVLGLSGYSDKRNSVDSPFSLWSLIMCDNNDTNPIIRAHPIFCNIYWGRDIFFNAKSAAHLIFFLPVQFQWDCAHDMWPSVIVARPHQVSTFCAFLLTTIVLSDYLSYYSLSVSSGHFPLTSVIN